MNYLDETNILENLKVLMYNLMLSHTKSIQKNKCTLFFPVMYTFLLVMYRFLLVMYSFLLVMYPPNIKKSTFPKSSKIINEVAWLDEDYMAFVSALELSLLFSN